MKFLLVGFFLIGLESTERYLFILLKLDLPTLELKVNREEDRKQYLAAMKKADDGDYSLLEQLIGEALTETLDSVQE